jgi:hypothetical protein
MKLCTDFYCARALRNLYTCKCNVHTETKHANRELECRNAKPTMNLQAPEPPSTLTMVSDAMCSR